MESNYNYLILMRKGSSKSYNAIVKQTVYKNIKDAQQVVGLEPTHTRIISPVLRSDIMTLPAVIFYSSRRKDKKYFNMFQTL